MKLLMPYIVLLGFCFLTILAAPVDFVLVWLLLWLTVYDEPSVWLSAFLAGLVVDVFSLQLWGTHSLVYIVLCIVFALFLRTQVSKSLFVFIPVLGSMLWLSHVTTKFLTLHTIDLSIPVGALLVELLLCGGCFVIFAAIFGQKHKEPLKLKIS